MHLLYLFSVWLHILAATAWLGGMLFLVLVVVPWMRRGGREHAALILRETGARFRDVGWVCFAIVLVTGSFNLWVRGVRLGDLVSPAWRATPFGALVCFKLSVFAGVLALSAAHDFSIGPRAVEAIAKDPGSGASNALRRKASVMGRMNALLALLLVALGVMIVRGVPR